MPIQLKTFDDYKNAYQKFQDDRLAFWADEAGAYDWYKTWDQIQTGHFKDGNVQWFEGASLNITENCLDRHLQHRGDKIAYIFEPNDPSEASTTYSYQELYEKVCQCANMLKKFGVQKGDRVCFYMAMTPEIAIAALACARIGAVHSIVFAGFSSQSLAGRINDCQAKILITTDSVHRGKKIVPLKDIADEALENCPSIETTIVHNRNNANISLVDGRDHWWHEEIDTMDTNCPAEIMQAEDPLFILYTSGSTGQPKGVVHTCGGYMVYAGYSYRHVFGVGQDDIYWCTADAGWITGHTYIIYGPLLEGTSSIIFEGVPTFPDAGRFWQVVDKYKVTHFYTAPTAIRALMCCGDEFVDSYDLSSLKILGTVGEPINEEAWHWYHEKIGKTNCAIVDTWWQTETGGIMSSPLHDVTPTKPGFATLPLPGIQPIIVDHKGNEIGGNSVEGNLCIKYPWPSVARTVYGDHKRYMQTYFSTYPGYYFTGDGCRRDKDGLYRITGRVDDVLNVSGHRLGTAEIENALDEHECVVETAIVGYPHDIKGQGIYAFLICNGDVSDTAQFKTELLETVTKIIGPIAKPDKIQIVPALPKTRSGKIMRRILRKIAANDTDNLGDTSTLLDPSVVEAIKNGQAI